MATGIKAKKKIKRVRDSIFFNNPDLVPIQDLFFWERFIENWKKYFKLDNSTDIFKYYDFDIVVCTPNIDPIINNVQEIEKTENYVIYKGGFGSTLKLDFSQPIPNFIRYAVKDIKELEKFRFEDPNDRRRFIDSFAVPDQYNLEKPFFEQIDNYKDDFCIFGNICEARETVWRVLGMEKEFTAIVDCPDELKRFALRAAEFNIELGKRQLENENIEGIIVYGDIGYANGLMMSPGSWKEIYYPSLKKICSELKKYNKPVIYHTDGNYLEVLEDLIEIGFDALHPNEAKAGIDVVKLRQKYNNRIAYLGNIDAANVLSGSKEDIKRELIYKLRAANNGGYMPGGDDIPPSVSPENYDYYINLLKKLRKFNMKDISNYKFSS